jgi:hypothetical protein
MKQSDRFTQMVERVQRGQGTTNNRWYLFTCDAVTLLRREHAALVKAVKKLDKTGGPRIDSNNTQYLYCGYQNAIADVLALLAQRRKGKQ